VAAVSDLALIIRAPTDESFAHEGISPQPINDNSRRGSPGQELQIVSPPSNNVLDGIYVGSYTADNLTTGGSVQIVCDDFRDDSNYDSHTYTTTAFSLGSSLGNTLWGSKGATLTQYEEAAWLTIGMLGQTGVTQGEYSFAIWAIFDAGDVANWLTKYGDAATCNAVFGTGSFAGGKCTAGKGGLVGQALAGASTYTPGEFSNVLILTPTGCSSNSCPEQEFLEVVAEGGSTGLYLLLAGLACFGAIILRSLHQQGTKLA